MSPWKTSYAARIVGASRTDLPLRRLMLALSILLILLGVTGDPARAEDPPSGKTLSACRIPPREALGDLRKPSPESKKGYTFILAASRFKFEGAYDRVIEQIDQAINIDPTNPRFYAERATARSADHQVSKAMEDLDHAISLDPRSSFAFLERGQLYLKMSEFDRAIADVDEAIKLFPRNASGHLLRAYVHLATREYDRAIEDIDQSIKLDPLCPAGFYARGFVYELKVRPTTTGRLSSIQPPAMPPFSCVGPKPIRESAIMIMPSRTLARR